MCAVSAGHTEGGPEGEEGGEAMGGHSAGGSVSSFSFFFFILRQQGQKERKRGKKKKRRRTAVNSQQDEGRPGQGPTCTSTCTSLNLQEERAELFIHMFEIARKMNFSSQ